MTNNYIAYLDVLGSKNKAENQDFDQYATDIINFQNELFRIISSVLEKNGKIYFFSDCAFIESKKLDLIIKALSELRDNLFDMNLFFKGTLIKGKLGAISGTESEEEIEGNYGLSVAAMTGPILRTCKEYADNIKGTLFFSRDVGKAVHYENILKGAAVYIDPEIVGDAKLGNDQEYTDIIHNNIVASGYISDVRNNIYNSFYDIKYKEQQITDSYIEKILENFTLSVISDVSYGRYYLTILITCINSINFSAVEYSMGEFENTPPLFLQILHLRKKHSRLYNSFKGLEFLYFVLINKFYKDFDCNNETTKEFTREILLNKKYLNKYQSCLKSLPKELLSSKSKSLFIEDIYKLLKDDVKPH